MTVREPMLIQAPVRELRPTQMTVGWREVEAKRRAWRERAEKDGPEFLGRHMMPVLLGPKGRNYIIDHHHLACALHAEGVEHVAVNVVADLSRLEKSEFWVFCDNRGWCHPFDADGVRRTYDDIPRQVAKLADDPFRSLAGELRRLGGYSKQTAPFEEFMWADFLRRRIQPDLLKSNFGDALVQAREFARSNDAGHLPGWCGPS